MSEANLLTCLHEDLTRVWAADTSADPEEWEPGTPSIGQCSVTALVVNAIFGGTILRFDLGVHGTHYGNLITLDGEERYVDLTKDPFDFGWKYSLFEERTREQLCANTGTFERFRLLSSRLSALWNAEGGSNE